MNVAEFLERVQSRANPTDAVAMAQYMRNQFAFLGIRSPQRMEIFKEIKPQLKISQGSELQEWVMRLYAQPEREYHYLALDMLYAYRKLLTATDQDMLAFCVKNHSWWDTIDPLASKMYGYWITTYPENVVLMDAYSTDDYFWFRRIAILHQLYYRQNTDATRLFAYVKANAQEEEFFIQKALGWALRQYAKTQPRAVVNFLAQHSVAPLTRREALKHISFSDFEET